MNTGATFVSEVFLTKNEGRSTFDIKANLKWVDGRPAYTKDIGFMIYDEYIEDIIKALQKHVKHRNKQVNRKKEIKKEDQVNPKIIYHDFRTFALKQQELNKLLDYK